jgi:hypothetical protein
LQNIGEEGPSNCGVTKAPLAMRISVAWIQIVDPKGRTNFCTYGNAMNVCGSKENRPMSKSCFHKCYCNNASEKYFCTDTRKIVQSVLAVRDSRY